MSQTLRQIEPLYSRLGGDADVGEIVALFAEEMPGRVAALTGRLQSGDWDGLRRLAHQLKGAAGSYGFDAITSSAERLESALRQQQPEDQIRTAAADLVALCRRARGGTP